MSDFIFQANIAHYRGLLAAESDPSKIATLRKSISEEEAKLIKWRALRAQSWLQYCPRCDDPPKVMAIKSIRPAMFGGRDKINFECRHCGYEEVCIMK